MTRPRGAEPIRFDAEPLTVGGRTILRLPEQASRALPSRGQVAVRGKLNGSALETVVEPDGSFGHWIAAPAAAPKSGPVRVEIEPLDEWPEPDVPEDLKAALAAAPDSIRTMWREITPMARWEWVRWVKATRNPETRRRRVEVSISKMRAGKRRPCCFNLASCTDPELSKNGKLIEA